MRAVSRALARAVEWATEYAHAEPSLVLSYASTPQDGSELDLGNLNTAPGRVITFAVANTGTSTLHAALSLSGQSNLTSAVLSASSVSVAPGGSTNVTVTADATATGAGGFDLVVVSDGGDLTIPCVFVGVEQDIEVSVGRRSAPRMSSQVFVIRCETSRASGGCTSVSPVESPVSPSAHPASATTPRTATTNHQRMEPPEV